MGWRMGGKRELKNLADHLHDNETVRFIAQGTYEDKQGIVALTDLRLLFLFHGMIGQAKEDFPLKLISSVQTKSGFATGGIKVHVSGNNAVISGILKNDLEPLANAVRQGMAEQHARAATSQPQAASAAPGPDPYEAMQNWPPCGMLASSRSRNSRPRRRSCSTGCSRSYWEVSEQQSLVLVLGVPPRLGAGPLEALLHQPGVTDVLVNGPDRVFIDRGAGLELTDVRFPCERDVRRLAQRLAASAARRLDEAFLYDDIKFSLGLDEIEVLFRSAPAEPGGCADRQSLDWTT
jgi:hypothetical protein